MARATLAIAVVLAALVPAAAQAFCGFYVGGADARLFNRASVVVLMRQGTKTVVSMQNDYQGPPEDFAMVVPVPTVLQREQVRTLPRDVFDRVDRMAAPRLVEYWEQDPCNETIGLGSLGVIGRGAGGGSGSGYGRGAGGFGVRVEAQFAVGEYDIVILSARDSAGLDGWLRAEGYRIPEGAEDALRPYVQAGTKFFVAKVNVQRVRYENGHAALSPLRFHYDSDTFSLPIRLGLLSSGGVQDLIVHILAPTRFEVANRPNVFIPTNLDVAPDARERFGAFYAALFDRTVERNPGAAITEYAWSAGSCDPCPGPVLDAGAMATLGTDVLFGAALPGGGLGSLPAAPSASTSSTPTVRVQPERAGVEYSADVVRRVVRRNLSQVRFCAQTRAPAAMGPQQVVLEMTIGAGGRVTRGEVASSTLGNAAFDRCAADATRRWTFPEPPPGSTVRVRFPLTFSPGPTGGGASGLVLTRLHLRYGRQDVGEDLVFRAAEPVAGGREVRPEGRLEEGARPASFDNFQGRYAIRHPWTGPITCARPMRGIWGGPPAAALGQAGSRPDTTPPVAATGLGLVGRGGVNLGQLLKQNVPELGITIADAVAGAAPASAQTTGAAPASPSAGSTARPSGQSPPSAGDARVHPVG
ncbi:MAG: TonB family protein, partial [Deltaproteobacteria bacterium]|nr:TonB family protein [Deltaproteobacteria bacterium]